MDVRRAGVLTLCWGLFVVATGCSLNRGRVVTASDSSKKPPMVVASRAPAVPVASRAVGPSSGPESPLDRSSADRFAPPRYPATPTPSFADATGPSDVRPVPRWDEPDRRLPAVEETQDFDR